MTARIGLSLLQGQDSFAVQQAAAGGRNRFIPVCAARRGGGQLTEPVTVLPDLVTW